MNAQNGVHTIIISGLNSNIVKQMYLATNDPIYNSTCSTNFLQFKTIVKHQLLWKIVLIWPIHSRLSRQHLIWC